MKRYEYTKSHDAVQKHGFREFCMKFEISMFHKYQYLFSVIKVITDVTAEVSSLTQLTNDAFRFKTPVFGSNAES